LFVIKKSTLTARITGGVIYINKKRIELLGEIFNSTGLGPHSVIEQLVHYITNTVIPSFSSRHISQDDFLPLAFFLKERFLEAFEYLINEKHVLKKHPSFKELLKLAFKHIIECDAPARSPLFKVLSREKISWCDKLILKHPEENMAKQPQVDMDKITSLEEQVAQLQGIIFQMQQYIQILANSIAPLQDFIAQQDLLANENQVSNNFHSPQPNIGYRSNNTTPVRMLTPQGTPSPISTPIDIEDEKMPVRESKGIQNLGSSRNTFYSPFSNSPQSTPSKLRPAPTQRQSSSAHTSTRQRYPQNDLGSATPKNSTNNSTTSTSTTTSSTTNMFGK
jgi:hypothetical protein